MTTRDHLFCQFRADSEPRHDLIEKIHLNGIMTTPIVIDETPRPIDKDVVRSICETTTLARVSNVLRHTLARSLSLSLALELSHCDNDSCSLSTFSFWGSQQNLYPVEYEGHFSSLLINTEQIRSRVKEIAKELHEEFRGRRPVLLCTLKGAFPFFVHLCDALQDYRQGYDVEFIRASSYEGTNSTGQVHLTAGGLKPNALSGRHVIVIEDIVDTGTTLSILVPHLKEESQPSSVEVCTLLDKRLPDVKKKYHAKFVGFSIPDRFIVGYGLDYNELYRDLKDIFVVSQKAIDFDASQLLGGSAK